jgi:hypothetical protein
MPTRSDADANGFADGGNADGAPAADAGQNMEGASSTEGGTAVDASPETGDAEAGPTSCMSTGTNPDRRLIQWPLPPDSPPLGEYSVAKETVLDNTTGLMWERVPPETDQTFADATARCSSLGAGGYTDWRLPTRIELLSIIDYGQSMTLLNSNVFGSVESPGYDTTLWSSSTYPLPNTAGQQFTVDPAHSWTGVDTPSAAHLSRCVRAGCVSTAATRFSNGDYTTLDTTTGVRWQRGTAPATMNSDDAQAYCAMLSLDGLTGWRLPTIRELGSLYDETQYTVPLYNTATFALASGDEYWSSTPDSKARVGWQLYTMYFGGDSSVLTEGTPASGTAAAELVRCVR